MLSLLIFMLMIPVPLLFCPSQSSKPDPVLVCEGIFCNQDNYDGEPGENICINGVCNQNNGRKKRTVDLRRSQHLKSVSDDEIDLSSDLNLLNYFRMKRSPEPQPEPFNDLSKRSEKTY